MKKQIEKIFYEHLLDCSIDPMRDSEECKKIAKRELKEFIEEIRKETLREILSEEEFTTPIITEEGDHINPDWIKGYNRGCKLMKKSIIARIKEKFNIEL